MWLHFVVFREALNKKSCRCTPLLRQCTHQPLHDNIKVFVVFNAPFFRYFKSFLHDFRIRADLLLKGIGKQRYFLSYSFVSALAMFGSLVVDKA